MVSARRRRQRAQTLTEFALISPVIFFLIFGIIDLGRAIYVQASLNQAANEGARVAVRGEIPDYAMPTDTEVVNAVEQHAAAALGPYQCLHGPVPTSFSTLPANQGWIVITEAPAPAAYEASPPPNAPGNAVLTAPPAGCNSTQLGNNTITNYPLQITVYYNFVPITPVIQQLVANHIILKADAVYRTEY
jgi:Flp pilus assembly protein TadG